MAGTGPGPGAVGVVEDFGEGLVYRLCRDCGLSEGERRKMENIHGLRVRVALWSW